jgi:hypothetical protein
MTKIMKKAHAGRGQATIWEIPGHKMEQQCEADNKKNGFGGGD